MKYLIKWLKILFRILLLIALILFYIAKMLLGISLGALYGACNSAIVITYVIFSALIIHLVSIIPVLWSAFNVYRTNGHNLFFAISACILHLPFLLTYASISLVIPTIAHLVTNPIVMILYYAYLGIEMHELKDSVIEDYNEIRSLAYHFFYKRFLNIRREIDYCTEGLTNEVFLLNHEPKMIAWMFMNFVYLGAIYCAFLFLEAITFIVKANILEDNEEHTQDNTQQIESTTEAICQRLEEQGGRLLPNSKHTILSDETISQYKSYQNAEIDKLLSNYKELKEKLLEEGTDPISLDRPIKEDTIIVRLPNKTEILYSKESFKKHIKFKLSDHHTEILESTTNIKIASIGHRITASHINEEMYIQPLYTDKDDTIYSAKLNEIEKEIIEIVSGLQMPQEKTIAVTKGTSSTSSFRLNLFGKNRKPEHDDNIPIYTARFT